MLLFIVFSLMLAILAIAFWSKNVMLFSAALSVIFFAELVICLKNPCDWFHILYSLVVLCILFINMSIGFYLFRNDKLEIQA